MIAALVNSIAVAPLLKRVSELMNIQFSLTYPLEDQVIEFVVLHARP